MRSKQIIKKHDHMRPKTLGACGLGLRREFLDELIQIEPAPLDFLEIAPENWLGIEGGLRARLFQAYAERYPMACHGLSLSIGGILPIDTTFVKQLKVFFNKYQIHIYSEHLSYCSDGNGQLYDLMPIPFTEEAVHYVATRIKQVQDILERKIALENVSYYALPKGELTEAEFINAILQEADCQLLLDVNNIYVNSVNNNYDAVDFLKKMPRERIAYLHVAGHWQKAPDLIIDTHGDDIIEPVWQLLKQTYEQFGILPTLLERDNDIPPLHKLLSEVKLMQQLQASINVEHYHVA